MKQIISKEGLKKLEKAMSDIGCPIEYKKTRPMNFYPLKFLYITMVVVKNLFNYGDEKFREAGKFASRIPLVLRLYLKYFGSLDKLIKGASRLW